MDSVALVQQAWKNQLSDLFLRVVLQAVLPWCQTACTSTSLQNGQNWGAVDESDTLAVPRTLAGKSVLLCPCALGLEGISS